LPDLAGGGEGGVLSAENVVGECSEGAANVF